jgi:hypothetical protein
MSQTLMNIRTRKLIGTVALLILVTVWVVLVLGASQFVLPNASAWKSAAYYVVAGLGWVPGAMVVISWMSRPDPE